MDREKTFQICFNHGLINWLDPCEINDAIPLDSKYRPADAMIWNGGRP